MRVSRVIALSKLTPKYGNDVGHNEMTDWQHSTIIPKEIENAKKHICKIFSDHNLKITIEANKKCVNYLDVTLTDLRSASFKPYMKPGNTSQYISVVNSNHPPTVLRTVPQTINKRLSNISSDKQSLILIRISLHIKKHYAAEVTTTH